MALPRRLALVTAPRPGEGFGSWTDRMAWLNRCSPGVMADLLGLELRGSSPEVRPRVCGVRADDGVRRAVCAATGVAGGAVDRMHLAVFDPGPLSAAAVLSVGETAARASAGREWVEVSGSRACPRCLLASGGVWQLWWKLSCAGVCPVHGVVLLDRCPSCGCVLRWGGTRPRVLPVAWSRPPTVCASSVGGRPCPQWLPLARVRPASASVGEFQRRWLEIAYGRGRPAVGGVEVSAAEWFAAFRACVLLLRLGLPGVLGRLHGVPGWCGQALLEERAERGPYGRRFGWGPASASAAAAFLIVVMPLLEAADARELSGRVRPLARAAIEAGCFGARPLARLEVPEVFARAVTSHAPARRWVKTPW
ncbi:TniQ family protein [Streptomyces flavidovirens]|uniref:TniQ family protein n=1 Tax=Streptomyces flavidovirens TaxID=67298 RepID=UPI0033A8BAE1